MKKKMDLALIRLKCRAHRIADNLGAADYVSMLIKILIAVVVGALLLGLIVALVNALWPELAQRITDMFTNGGGTSSVPSTPSAGIT